MTSDLIGKSSAGYTIQNHNDGVVELCISGSWKAGANNPEPQRVFDELTADVKPSEIRITADNPAALDMSLPTFVFALNTLCLKNNISLVYDDLPDATVRLLNLATAVPEREGARLSAKKDSFLIIVGKSAIETGKSWHKSFDFIGECTLSFGRFLSGRAQFRWSDVALVIQDCGPRALPIVTLIGFLMGLILAFVGAIQLKMFGAEIYVANLVGVGIVRALGSIMTGIVMAGRTGASFAAELGTMQVNEETDALKTLGISPYDFLVLPRMLGLTLMMPLLCLYADLMGLLGGLVVGVGVLNLSPKIYINQTLGSLNLTQVWIGLFMSFTFGILVSMAGCKQGINCGRSSSSVGTATNAAVVNSIINIVVATAIITVACSILGI
ncbi:MAG: ABC transporter permease [Kiritimatiellae bacterium]|jgi:phospholipid/cholesterol/gamma-HCH transport system permease protein|nr:ABC transporter permease [Kiritimatiellia bacterium]